MGRHKMEPVMNYLNRLRYEKQFLYYLKVFGKKRNNDARVTNVEVENAEGGQKSEFT